MKKAKISGLLTLILIFSMLLGLSVSAAKSKEVVVEEIGSLNGTYKVTTQSPEYEELTEEAIKANAKVEDKAAAIASAKDALEKINKINKGEKVTISTAIDNELNGKSLIQAFFDLDEVGEHKKCYEQGYHTVTLRIDALTRNCRNITVLHYSTDRTLWETIPEDKIEVDYENHTIKFNVQDLSPMAVYAKVVSEGAEGTSPSTGSISSTWLMYPAFILVVVGIGMMTYKKKRG